MTIVYQVKRSETSSSTPGSSDLAVGELAVNLADAKIFSKKNDGTIVSFNTSTETPVFFADEVDLGNLTTATNTYDMSGLTGGSPASGGGIALTDLSVLTNSAGTAALSYNSSTGAFTYTPPDLSSYLTSYTVSESDVTTHQAALSITEAQITDLQSYLTSESFASLVQDTSPQLGGDLDLNSSDITGTGNINIDGILTQGTASYYTHQYVLHGTTTDATETEILTTASTRIPVSTNTTLFYEISIVARRTDATGESGSWHLKGCVDNFSGTVADVGNVYEIAVAQDDVSLAVDARADDTNNSINIYVTGAASKTIRWTAIVKTTEVAQ